MTSNTTYSEAYVWIWLPDTETPIVAGLLSQSENQLVFNYGRSYLENPHAIPIYAPELPLQSGTISLVSGLSMPSCIRDASPDAWGRRVLINRKFGEKSIDSASIELDELTYLMESGSDRIGALDFQASPTHYISRERENVSLETLLMAAEKVEQGLPLPPELSQPLIHGTSLGGARPKVLIDDGESQFIAKFSTSSDLYSVVKGEYIAMRLAAKIGLDVAPVHLTSALGKDVLLIKRFDRVRHGTCWQRRAMVSALTILELDEMMAAYASYEKLGEIIRHRFKEPKATLRELFSRIVFNILCGNTDDHARNHAAFWDGHHLTLTPAYDICPQPRSGEEASQAMLIHDSVRSSQIGSCITAAPIFLIKQEEAMRIVNRQVAIIQQEWETVCDEANLTAVDQRQLWRRQFLNPFAFYGASEEVLVPSY
ncbi:MAG: type II toxin-antitoxin system HipA family toxin [Gammaproteobacteria bacterium]|jgi:serine/threonine-protein kinase HipA|nr:type II toxin-antitoxin system HipA family toxin [Gammaproteobacteria bacterium]MBT7308426.1 type II toxin-antitoxin system HipA family toxin [Gammaproteobacteria bacterium]